MIEIGFNRLRPVLHFTAEKNWLNDPNGLSMYQGRYHLFYQHNPLGTEWGHMSWGHAVTKDWVHYDHLPVALYPDQDYDFDGVFSGSALEYHGEHVLYYTGVSTQGDDYIQVQCMATSMDGVHYSKASSNPILVGDGQVAHENDFRDPKVWQTNDGLFVMVVGSKDESDGKILVYTSKDGHQFKPLTAFEQKGLSRMWECPDYFELEEQGYLMVSAIDYISSPDEYVANVSLIAPAQLDIEKGEAYLGEFKRMDYGDDLYAPQTILDENGHRLMIGWLRMKTPLDSHHNFTGMMTLPRQLIADGEGCRYRVVQSIYESRVPFSGVQQGYTSRFDCPVQSAYLFELTWSSGHEMHFSFVEDSCLSIGYSPMDGCVVMKRKTPWSAEEKRDCYASPAIDSEQIRVKIYMDVSVVEIYIQDGAYVISGIYLNEDMKHQIAIQMMDLSGKIEAFTFRALT